MVKLIKLLGYEDYFYIIKKGDEYNSTSKLELYSLNSESYIVKGYFNVLTYLIKFKMNWL